MIGHLALDLALVLADAAGLFINASSGRWRTGSVHWPSERTEGQGEPRQGALTTRVRLVGKVRVEPFQTNIMTRLPLSFCLSPLHAPPLLFPSPHSSQLWITQPVLPFKGRWITQWLRGALTFKGSRWEAISMLCKTIRTRRLHSWSNTGLPVCSQTGLLQPGSTRAADSSAKLSPHAFWLPLFALRSQPESSVHH